MNVNNKSFVKIILNFNVSINVLWYLKANGESILFIDNDKY